MSINYYTDHRSGSCRRVSTVIEELGIQVNEIFVDLLAGENRSEKMLKLNPHGMLPVLVDELDNGEKLVLSEAAAINIYLCEKYNDNKLLPSDSERYQVLKWMSWGAEHFRQAAPIYFEENVMAALMGAQPNQARLREGEKLLEIHGAVLDQHLEGRNYIVGDHLTLADIDLAAALSQMPRSNIPFDRFKNIMRWANGLDKNVKSWRKTGIELNDGMNKALGISHSSKVVL